MIASGFDTKVKANDITISYDDIGPESGPVIIFVHGFPFDKTSWDLQILALSTSCRCIAYDIRGFGHTNNQLSKLSIELFADDLNAFMRELGINKAILCGLSMGGYIALQAYHKYPEYFSGLILSNTQCYPDSEEAREKRAATIQQIRDNGKENFAADFVQKIFSEKTLSSENEHLLVSDITKTINATSDATLTRTLKALAERPDMCFMLKDIQIPVLIICGEDDKVTPVKLSEKMHSEIKNSTLKIISNAGHLSNLEQPVIFNTLIQEFIEINKLAV